MYREINDYEMLYLICDNDDNNYEICLEKYYPLITKFACKYKNILKKMGFEIEDLIQVGYITLLQTIKGYNGDKNNNLFYTYFLKSLENSYIGLIRNNNSNKKKVLNEAISYDNFFPNSELTYAEIFPDPDTLDIDYINESGLRYHNFKNSLEFDLACILDLKMEGYKNKEIEILLNLTCNELLKGLKIIKNKGINF